MYGMKHSLPSLVGTLGLALLGAACSSGDGGGGQDSSPATTSVASGASTSTQLRAVHASADTGAVDVRVNGAIAFSGVTFREASSAAGVASGTTRIQINPAGTATSAIDVSVPLAQNRDYVAIAAGNSTAGTPADQAIGALLIEDEGNAPQAGNVKVRVVHGAPGVPAVNIFVTAPAGRAKLRVLHLSPDAPAVDVVVLDATGAVALRPVTDLAFPNATGYLDLAPGTYRVAVVRTGGVTPLLPPPTSPSAIPGVSLTLLAGDVTTALAVGCLNVATGPCAGGGHFQIIALEDN